MVILEQCNPERIRLGCRHGGWNYPASVQCKVWKLNVPVEWQRVSPWVVPVKPLPCWIMLERQLLMLHWAINWRLFVVQLWCWEWVKRIFFDPCSLAPWHGKGGSVPLSPSRNRLSPQRHGWHLEEENGDPLELSSSALRVRLLASAFFIRFFWAQTGLRSIDLMSRYHLSRHTMFYLVKLSITPIPS